MKANELMIGDWVKAPAGYMNIQEINPDFPYWDEIEPIPLTAEILEKNGFELFKDESYYLFVVGGKRDGVLIKVWLYDDPVYSVKALVKIDTESSKDSGINYLHSCDIDYVHELQHALRLCKIDKDIEL